MTPFLRLLVLVMTLALGNPALADRTDRAIGLSGVNDWSTQQPFLDAMKTARPWIGHKPGQWGGVAVDELRMRGLLDANGWPRQIPPDLRGIGTVVLTDLPPQAISSAGRYRLTYVGDGIVEVGGRASGQRYGPGWVEFDFVPGEGPVVVTINRTDRQGTGDYIRDIRIIRTDRLALAGTGAVFNPDWTARLAPFGTLRFMDWMETNGSAIARWDDRPRVTDYTWAEFGVPLEIMLRLANELRANPWFNMPHMADDAYVRAFATQVRDGLNPALRAHVEYSNEVWNWQFPQADWAERQARARWGVDHAWMQYYGVRSAEVATIWKDVYGADAPARLVTVIATQTGWQGLEVDALEAPRHLAEGGTAPALAVDAYAIAGYFGRALGTPERAGMVHGWLADSLARAEAGAAGLTGAARDDYIAAHRHDAAIATAARELRDGSVSGDVADTLADLRDRTFPYHAEVAARYGLDLLMYEGGSHVAGVAELLDDEALTAFFVALNYSPEMGRLYSELLEIWHATGGGAFNAYSDVVHASKWGSWGALRHLDDSNPRWEALVR